MPAVAGCMDWRRRRPKIGAKTVLLQCASLQLGFVFSEIGRGSKLVDTSQEGSSQEEQNFALDPKSKGQEHGTFRPNTISHETQGVYDSSVQSATTQEDRGND